MNASILHFRAAHLSNAEMIRRIDTFIDLLPEDTLDSPSTGRALIGILINIEEYISRRFEETVPNRIISTLFYGARYSFDQYAVAIDPATRMHLKAQLDGLLERVFHCAPRAKASNQWSSIRFKKYKLTITSRVRPRRSKKPRT